MKKTRQSGQALVAALVTVAIIFALAGGLATAVSAVLSQQRGAQTPFLGDIRGQSTISALAAAVSVPGAGCPVGGIGQGGELTGYSCSRIPLIRPLSPGSVTLTPQSAGCATGAVNVGGRLTLWLNALAPANSLFVDGNSAGCSAGPQACLAAASGHLLLVRDCDLSAFASAYVHVLGPAGPSVVRYATASSFVAAAGSPIGINGQVSALAAGHFHAANDGISDLAVAVSTTSQVAVLLGNGDGTFRPGPVWAADSPQAIIAADFNGDGIDDIAYTSPDPDDNSVTVQLASRDGSFQQMSGSPFRVGAYPAALAAGHFRAGDQLDLAVANRDSGSVSILLSQNGSFAPAVDTPVPGSPVIIATASLRSNGRDDLVIGTNQVLTYLSRSDGTFSDLDSFGVGLPPTRLVAADVTSDGRPDVLVVNPSGLTVLRGDGTGRLAPLSAIGFSGTPIGLALGRFAGDSQVDVAVLLNSGVVVPLIGSGQGTFSQAVGGPVQLGGSSPSGLATGSFTGDPSNNGFATGAAGQLWVMLPNPKRLFSLLGPGASGIAGFDEADLVVGGGAPVLDYEGGL